MFQSQYPTVAKMAMEERFRTKQPTGIRRSARLISLQIRRSREAGHIR